MTFNWDLRVPYLYSNRYITLRDLEQIMLRDYHPEYVRRFIGWLHYKNGNVGAGGLSRTEQPNQPGFAPTLQQSFHWAGQKYADGVTGACAVDTVMKDGPDPGDAHDGIPWSEVPAQGSAEATRWGLHANVGVPGKGESWHIQPVEIDGHASWVAAGRPAPRTGYPIPVEHDPYHTPDPDEDDEMSKPAALIRLDGTNYVYAQWAGFKAWIPSEDVLKLTRWTYDTDSYLSTKPGFDPETGVVVIPATAIEFFAVSGPIVGPLPPRVDGWGRPI